MFKRSKYSLGALLTTKSPGTLKEVIVYYHPRKIYSGSNRGSDIRVSSMLNAFMLLGFDVVVVAGNHKERRRCIRWLQNKLGSEIDIKFVYGESTNAPIAFAERSFLPGNCFVDYAFFRWLKKKKIPFGLFYRDIYWRFDFFTSMLVWPLSYMLKPLYYLDWYFFNKYSDVLFLPSESMNKHLPKKRNEDSFFALPPGFSRELVPRPEFESSTCSPLKLLYVGGISPSVYDVSFLMKVVRARDDVFLTICCRRDEWQKYKEHYDSQCASNIEIVHVGSDELSEYYHSADVFLMVMEYSEYRDFAMPVKFAEAIGYALPVISMNQKEVAKKIHTEDVGWVLSGFEEFDPLLTELKNNRKLLVEKYQNILSMRDAYLWEARALKASEKLQVAKV